jgi:hypothetical protein
MSLLEYIIGFLIGAAFTIIVIKKGPPGDCGPMGPPGLPGQDGWGVK